MNKLFPRLLSFLLVLIWGSSYLSIGVVVAQIHPVTAALYRFTLAGLLMLVVRLLLAREKVAWPDRLRMMISGLFGITLYTMLENTAVLWTSPGNVSVILAIIPVLTLLLQRLLYKEKLLPVQVIGTLASFGGVAWIMVAKGPVSLFARGFWGDLMTLGAALSWIAYTMLNRNFTKSYQSLTVMAEGMIWGAVFLAPFAIYRPLVLPSGLVAANLLFQVIVCSAIGYFLYLYCLRHLGPVEMTNYINLMPIVALSLSAWLFHEVVNFNQIGGSALILAGVTLVTLGPNLFRRKDA